MKTLLIPLLAFVFFSCQTTETIVSAGHGIKNNTILTQASQTFIFKDYHVSLNNDKALLSYRHNQNSNDDNPLILLSRNTHDEKHSHKEFSNETEEIVICIISDYEVKLQIDNTSYTLFSPKYLKEVNADTNKILADIAIYRDSRY
ncbi:hypothetical protein [Myroides pelagicus]|uniref:Lipoprotein n=1 Tax=Myroides pelagicus TaxID=270914 RepID=A0A7K1GQA2_9FLAO|nr:hypothetical protein [Myroides pelagicus]MEC4114639.1 hypothetical protein [Myroides pelagicus]MTH30719.1 hypothetical protein [Myroides pelagicus]